jgi:DegV family protein with EDD domain
MPDFHIITDSGATLTNSRLVTQYPITFVPNKITINGQTYREGIDASSDELVRMMHGAATPPIVTPPTTAEFTAAYARAARNSPAIISLHTSRELSQSWHNGRLAARHLIETCPIANIDSQTICVGLGMLVRVATQAIQVTHDFEAAVQHVRGAVERLFSLYYVESLDFLQQRQIMGPSRAILAAITGVKPFLSMEEGKLIVTEKVRTRAQAVERLVEFVGEFEELEDTAIIQHRPALTEQARMLQERFAVDFPGRHFPCLPCGASLAALIGTDATGVVVLEKEGLGSYDGDD